MRQRPSYQVPWSVTLILIILNVVVFIVENAISPYGRTPFYATLELSATDLMHGHVWQLLTFQFLHAPLHDGGIFHLAGNCFTIYVFGHAVEEVFGKWSFLRLYLASGVVGGLVQVAAAFAWPHYFGGPVVGASAGAFGLVAAFAMRFPDQILKLFLLPVELRAKTLLWVSIGLSALGIALPESLGGRVAHWAHLGGIFTGIIYVRYLADGARLPATWRPFRKATRPRELVSARLRPAANWQPPKPAPPTDLPPGEFISREVDPILDKISAHGIQSLTERERQILEAARAKIARR